MIQHAHSWYHRTHSDDDNTVNMTGWPAIALMFDCTFGEVVQLIVDYDNYFLDGARNSEMDVEQVH